MEAHKTEVGDVEITTHVETEGAVINEFAVDDSNVAVTYSIVDGDVTENWTVGRLPSKFMQLTYAADSLETYPSTAFKLKQMGDNMVGVGCNE
jgi:hypothetical protein